VHDSKFLGPLHKKIWSIVHAYVISPIQSCWACIKIDLFACTKKSPGLWSENFSNQAARHDSTYYSPLKNTWHFLNELLLLKQFIM